MATNHRTIQPTTLERHHASPPCRSSVTSHYSSPLINDEAEDLAQLDWQLTRQVPAAANTRMPTKLGNILRAAELTPLERYGLNAVLCWPHLWMVLPETARTDLSTARKDLNTAARIWLWSVLFCGWALLAFCARAHYTGTFFHLLWPLPLGLLSAYFGYQWAINAAETYASLLRAAYDLYRFELYDALGIDKPENPETEKQRSQALNQYLFRGY